MRQYAFKRAAVGMATVALISLVPHLGRAQSPQSPWRNLSLAQLSAVWWQWAFSSPVSLNPFFDDTGAHAYSGQPYSDLLFLAGTFVVNGTGSGDVVGESTRSITVKQGTALFYPLINSEFDNVCGTPHWGGNCFGVQPFPTVLGVPELQAIVKEATDSILRVNSSITPTDATFKTAIGAMQPLAAYRLASPPFSYRLPATDNLYQASGFQVSGTVAPAAADGYYSFVPGTLAPGYYVLRFGGSTPINAGANTFTLAITYDITVTP
jgi:hypothetical protein